MALISPPDLAGPFPPKGAGDDLKHRLVSYLKSSNESVGSRFLTESELAERSGLSRSTVRRALGDLQREGWVRREIGRGTFVGPRVAEVGGRTREAREVRGTYAEDVDDTDRRLGSSAMRIGVVVLWQDSGISDWYSPAVLRGIDLECVSIRASVELLGHTGDNPDELRSRLEQSRPDVLVCLAGSLAQAFVIRDAQRLGIPVICAGADYRELGLPSVCEDNAQAVRLAYDHLVEHGHERIGLLLTMQHHPFIFERLAAFRECCEAASRPGAFDSGSVHWVNADGALEHIAPEADRVPEYLQRYRPTALISGNAVASRVLGLAAHRHRIAIPEQVSTVSFDQSPEAASWLGLGQPTTIAIPLEQMGRQLTRLAHTIHTGGAFEPELIPCELVPGVSVAEYRPA